MYNQAVEDLIFSLKKSDEQNVYFVIDGARDPRIYSSVRLSAARHACLYEGDLPDVLAQTAPYIIEITENHRFTRWIIDKGWRNSFGIFVYSDLSLRKVRRQLRKYLLVKDPNQKTLYFRFYDPRVMRVYLPTCNESELEYVFGPINFFAMENQTGNSLLTFEWTYPGLKTEEFPIAKTVFEE